MTLVEQKKGRMIKEAQSRHTGEWQITAHSHTDILKMVKTRRRKRKEKKKRKEEFKVRFHHYAIRKQREQMLERNVHKPKGKQLFKQEDRDLKQA